MKIVHIDGKDFETNGIFQYKNRGIPVGALKYDIGKKDIWRKAALEYGEEEFIYDVPRLVGGGNLINLGDLGGGSAILLAQGLRDAGLEGHVYTVDCYPDREKRRSEANMERAGVRDRITILQQTTKEAHQRFASDILFGKEFSFVFIDADHSFRGVRSDFCLYSLLLKEDGILSFHDTNQTDTNRVITETVTPDWKLEYWINRIKAFRRR